MKHVLILLVTPLLLVAFLSWRSRPDVPLSQVKAAVRFVVQHRCEHIGTFEQDTFHLTDLKSAHDLTCGRPVLRLREAGHFPDNVVISYTVHKSAKENATNGHPLDPRMYVHGDVRMYPSELSDREWRAVLAKLPPNEASKPYLSR